MPSDMQPLGNFVTLVSGSTPSKANPDFWGGNTPWISAKDMGDFWIEEAEDHLTEAGVAAASRLVPEGTVLLLARGMTLHKRVPICRVTHPSTFNQDVKAVLPKKGLSSRFLPYLLVGNHDRLHERVDSAGHGTGRLNSDALLAFPVRVPSPAEQESIADIGEAIDDRLRLLRQTNLTLEAIARTLFRSWFIDFEPARAKAEGREPESMDVATASLFPSEFESSPLGSIPKGWQVRSLDSISSYLNGLALQKYPPESDDEYLPVIKIAQLRAGHSEGADRASARLRPEYVVHDGDLLFSWSGSLEVEFWCGGDGALNQHLFKVTSTEVPQWLSYLATRHFLPAFREIAAHKATTMGHIQRKHITEARLALPPSSQLPQIGASIQELLERRICNALLSRDLAKVRDTMLPRLLSGKLPLPECQEELREMIA